MWDSATRTMHLYQHHSCRSSSCPCSSPPGCRNTAELPAGSLPSSSASPPPGPATRTSGCRLQQRSSESVSTGTAWPLQGPQPAQVGQGQGFCLHWFAPLALSLQMQRRCEDVHVKRKWKIHRLACCCNAAEPEAAVLRGLHYRRHCHDSNETKPHKVETNPGLDILMLWL